MTTLFIKKFGSDRMKISRGGVLKFLLQCWLLMFYVNEKPK